MKSLEDLKLLRDELKAAYETVLNNEHTKYDNATVAYALKCYQDAENMYVTAFKKFAGCEHFSDDKMKEILYEEEK